jgi:hypothetical protein
MADYGRRRHLVFLILMLIFAVVPFFKLFASLGVMAKGDYTFPSSMDQICRAIAELSHPWDPSRYAQQTSELDKARTSQTQLPMNPAPPVTVAL